MDVAWQSLVANLSIFSVIILGWIFAQSWLERWASAYRQGLFVLVMGAGVAATMSFAVELGDGVYFDLRAAFVVIAGAFGGPLAAVLVGGVAMTHRAISGGAGMWIGLSGIVLYALLGVWAHHRRLHQQPRPFLLALLVIGVAAATLAPAYVMSPMTPLEDILRLVLPALVLNCLAILGGSLVILQAGLIGNERLLLRAAITQAPDFFFVKDRGSRYVAVNGTVASYNGYALPDDVRGKSDYDFASEERADALFAAEQDMMRSRIPQIDIEENITGPDGSERWFVTSKAPIHNQDGAVIGLVGVTRDVTERRRVDAALVESRNLLSYALAEMSDGLAMFDRNGVLVFCNEQYCSAFPLTGDVRRPGMPLRDILRRVVETGEQLAVTPANGDAWIETVLASLHLGGEEQVALYDGRWLHVRTRPTEDGSAFVLVSDATTMKVAETDLRKMTEQLSLLATTDGLTGLMNRRAFDTALDGEWLRAARSASPLSLLMIDVDNFKTYNDLYGHQAGDGCLRRIATVLRDHMRRPADIAARYGGEEFVVVLPETDEDGAFFIAESIRRAVREIGIPHSGSSKGVVTVSAGLATLPPAPNASASELVARADGALYTAKSAGRDRVTGWREATLFRQERAAS